MSDLQKWKHLYCICGHNKYDHADEHDEMPTGTGKCDKCSCQSYINDKKVEVHGST